MSRAGSLEASVRAGLRELEPIDVRDRATADLAVLYAQRIDDALAWDANPNSKRPEGWRDTQRDPVAELGPKLLQALIQLGMTPAARKSIVEPKAAPARSPLDELRERRAARTSG